jgi:hypothetical protein
MHHDEFREIMTTIVFIAWELVAVAAVALMALAFLMLVIVQ